MSDEQVPAGITTEEWQATPLSVRVVVLHTLQQLVQLQERVAALEERLHQNSHNSSKPPSADPPQTPSRLPRVASGRKAGGQPGHVGHSRPLKPRSQVQRVVELRPTSCAHCGALLLGTDSQPERHQVTELPRSEPQVTEYRRHTLHCLHCGETTQAGWPSDMPRGEFGPRLQATSAYLSGRLGLSQRDIVETFDTLLHVELSLGSIPAQAQVVSAALAAAVSEAQTYVQQQVAANVDETGWFERAQHVWLWLAATPLVSVFLILHTRGAAGLQTLLGKPFAGIVSSDRWSAYNGLDPSRRQVCWAHLQRDFQKLAERGGESQRIGTALLAQGAHVFALWSQLRAGTLSRPDFQTAVLPVQAQVQSLLREGAQLSHAQTRRLCQNLLKIEVALWTFVRTEGIEPTNNLAERGLRRAVLWRRRSFGTQSEAGSVFVARILTVVTSLRQQHRDVLDYLTDACLAAGRGDKPPSLLPTLST